MKRSFDENLSRKLVVGLAELSLGSVHRRGGEAVRITEFLADPELGVLVLDRD